MSTSNPMDRAALKVSTVLVTGATGFIGQHMVKTLLSAGYTVLGLHRRISTDELLQDDQLHWVSTLQVKQEIERHQPEAVIHLATDYGIGTALSALAESNIRLPLHWLELAAANGCSLFINTDSYFAKQGFNYPHMKPYIQSKNEFMRWAALAADAATGLDIVNARLEHVYGPGDGDQKFIPHLLTKLLDNQPIALTPGGQLRDFIHVEDVVAAYLAILNRPGSFEHRVTEIEVGTGVPQSLRAFVDTAWTLTRSSSVLNFGALPYRDQEIMCSVADPAALLALGWSPCHNITTGIQATLDNVNQRAENISPRKGAAQ